jgi:hypothetical protein
MGRAYYILQYGTQVKGRVPQAIVFKDSFELTKFGIKMSAKFPPTVLALVS